jgi:hypothetical protein
MLWQDKDASLTFVCVCIPFNTVSIQERFFLLVYDTLLLDKKLASSAQTRNDL